MISIQAIMMLALGFLGAGFFAVLIAPAYRKRAARLAVEELKRTMPLSEAEIRADKDRLRAEYAVHIHKLQVKVDQSANASARQRIELNRRDAVISSLEGEVAELRTSMDEHTNARRVLEQSIMDRLPKVEKRLRVAKEMLGQRDQEIASLTQTAGRQEQALEEARQINTQQQDEVHRLGAALQTRSVRHRDGHVDARYDGEVALRTEIEALRAKNRDQNSLITRLQENIASLAGSASSDDVGDMVSFQARTADDIARLSKDLAAAESALREAQSQTKVDERDRSSLQTEIERMEAAAIDQEAKVARLEASLKAYKAAEKGNKLLAESKMSLKAQVMALEAQATKNTSTIESLRAELAAANERLARQAKHFMDEMRRIGAGTIPARRSGMAGSGSDAAMTAAASTEQSSRASLFDRISQPRTTGVKASTGGGDPARQESSRGLSVSADNPNKTSSPKVELETRSARHELNGDAGGDKTPANGDAGSRNLAARMSGSSTASSTTNSAQSASVVDQEILKSRPKKQSLLDRITRLEADRAGRKSSKTA